MFKGLTFFGVSLEWYLRAGEAAFVGTVVFLVAVWALLKIGPVRRWWRIYSVKWATKWIMRKW